VSACACFAASPVSFALRATNFCRYYIDAICEEVPRRFLFTMGFHERLRWGRHSAKPSQFSAGTYDGLARSRSGCQDRIPWVLRLASLGSYNVRCAFSI